MIYQKEIILPEYPRGFHLITSKITDELPELPKAGMLNIFICHTSAGITINENASPDVRKDMESSFNRIALEDPKLYLHDEEGPDDMPAHIKSSLTGVSINIPIMNEKLALGTWQGIFLCEYRNRGGRRKLILTVFS